MQVEQAPGLLLSPAAIAGQQTGDDDFQQAQSGRFEYHQANFQQEYGYHTDSTPVQQLPDCATAAYQHTQAASYAAFQPADFAQGRFSQPAQLRYADGYQLAQSGIVAGYQAGRLPDQQLHGSLSSHQGVAPHQQIDIVSDGGHQQSIFTQEGGFQADSMRGQQPDVSGLYGIDAHQQAGSGGSDGYQAYSIAVPTSSGRQGFAPDQADSRPLQKALRPLTSRPGYAVYQIPKRPEFRTRDVFKQLAVTKPAGASSRQSQQQAAAAPHQVQQPTAQQAPRQAQQPSVAQQASVTQQAPRQTQQPRVAQQAQRQAQQQKPQGGSQQHTSRSSIGPAVMTMPRPANVPAALGGHPRAAVPAQTGSNCSVR